MSHTVICSMKNEGPFIVEWVAWQRMLGFSGTLVLTNDCADQSPALLDALADAGWLCHVPVSVPPDRSPLHKKLTIAQRHPLVLEADWTFICDVDEFLVIHRGEGLIEDLLPAAETGFAGLSVNWRVFGTSGHKRWEDGLTHRQFTQAALESDQWSRWYKSAFRAAGGFDRLGEHSPIAVSSVPSAASNWVASSGVLFSPWAGDEKQGRMMEADVASFAVAQLNHYMVRSRESYRLKHGTLSAAALRNRYTDYYFKIHNRNEAEDTSALRHAEAFDRIHAEAMALPGVRRLHHLCCADYVACLAVKTGREAGDDPRWQHHMRMALGG